LVVGDNLPRFCPVQKFLATEQGGRERISLAAPASKPRRLTHFGNAAMPLFAENPPFSVDLSRLWLAERLLSCPAREIEHDSRLAEG